jgi:hypothetical protein
LTEVRIDKKIVSEFLSDLRTAEDLYQEQLYELRGVPYTYTAPVDDPFAHMYGDAHSHAQHNRDEIALSQRCGCFFCRAVFDAKVPMEYVDDGRTALCPNCGCDAVIGDKAGYELTDDFLKAMFRKWFSIPIRLAASKKAAEAPIVPASAPELKDLLQQFTPSEFDRPVMLAPELETEVPAGVGAGLVATLPDEPDEEEDC